MNFTEGLLAVIRGLIATESQYSVVFQDFEEILTFHKNTNTLSEPFLGQRRHEDVIAAITHVRRLFFRQDVENPGRISVWEDFINQAANLTQNPLRDQLLFDFRTPHRQVQLPSEPQESPSSVIDSADIVSSINSGFQSSSQEWSDYESENSGYKETSQEPNQFHYPPGVWNPSSYKPDNHVKAIEWEGKLSQIHAEVTRRLRYNLHDPNKALSKFPEFEKHLKRHDRDVQNVVRIGNRRIKQPFERCGMEVLYHLQRARRKGSKTAKTNRPSRAKASNDPVPRAHNANGIYLTCPGKSALNMTYEIPHHLIQRVYLRGWVAGKEKLNVSVAGQVSQTGSTYQFQFIINHDDFKKFRNRFVGLDVVICLEDGQDLVIDTLPANYVAIQQTAGRDIPKWMKRVIDQHDAIPNSFPKVSIHNSVEDLWLILYGKVYNVTNFQSEHPGGAKILLKFAGKDATTEFEKFHNAQVILNRYSKLCIGEISTVNLSDSNTQRFVQAGEKPSRLHSGQFSSFGDPSPFVEPLWLSDYASPYYNASHIALSRYLREIVEQELEPFVFEWSENKSSPKSVYKSLAQRGIIAFPYPWTRKYLPPNLPNPAGITSEQHDLFHNLVFWHEFQRTGYPGAISGLWGGNPISVPTLMYSQEDVKREVLPKILLGDTTMSLCITEPQTGSDSANIEGTAVLSKDKEYFVVNATKKWITGGVNAGYFVTAVRTGGPGAGGVSLLLIPRGPGISVQPMNVQGAWGSGTALVVFEDVKVPVKYLLGELNKGFKVITSNFNLERIQTMANALFGCRVAYRDALKYACRRKVFGQYLIELGVIRNKLAQMAVQIEANQALLEMICYQYTQWQDQATLNDRIGPLIALLKANIAQTGDMVVREASQILGGNSYTRGGVGSRVENLFRMTRYWSIPAGSTEVMLDFGVRNSIKKAKVMGAKL